MRATRTDRDRLHSKAFASAAILLLGAAAGCGGASVAAVSNTAAATGTRTAAGTSAVTAAGGGDFCKAIAAAVNKQAAAGTSSKEISTRIATVRKEEEQAVSLAPGSIKADVVRLLAASDAVWSALAKVNYDYSQLKATDMSALSSPETVAAEGRVTAYLTGTCGISAATPPAQPSH
jgi:hypothetical protein